MEKPVENKRKTQFPYQNSGISRDKDCRAGEFAIPNVQGKPKDSLQELPDRCDHADIEDSVIVFSTVIFGIEPFEIIRKISMYSIYLHQIAGVF